MQERYRRYRIESCTYINAYIHTYDAERERRREARRKGILGFFSDFVLCQRKDGNEGNEDSKERS